MSVGGPCPICGENRPGPPLVLPGLRIVWCRACGHREAIHDGQAIGSDYHEQYDDGAFLDALRATRIRQASLLIGALRRHVPDLSGVVDYGAGRGWFLEACGAAGIAPIAGVDTSGIAVEGLKASGIEGHRLLQGEEGHDVLAALSFRPRVVSLLDVLEHFPPDGLETRLRGIVSACGEKLELVILKVPVAGLLYAGAAALCRLGKPGPLRQLYQAGTWPPHFNYFSTGSAERLLAASGLSVVERIGDPDFEPEFLGKRIGASGPFARSLSRIGGEVLRASIRVTGRFDSAILLARPTSARPA